MACDKPNCGSNKIIYNEQATGGGASADCLWPLGVWNDALLWDDLLYWCVE
jgi:hypothetical protein